MTPNGSLALVASQDGRVTLHLATTGAIVATFTMAGSPFRALVSPDGSRGYALSSVGDLLMIDLASRAAVGTVATGMNAANGLALNAAGTIAYVTSMHGSGVATVDLGTKAVSRRYSLAGTLQDVVVAPGGQELLIADETGTVIKLNIASGVAQRVTVPAAFGLALSVNGAELWITQPGVGSVTVLDVATGVPSRTIALNGGNSIPRRIAFNGGGAAVVTDERGFLHLIR